MARAMVVLLVSCSFVLVLVNLRDILSLYNHVVSEFQWTKALAICFILPYSITFIIAPPTPSQLRHQENALCLQDVLGLPKTC